MRWNLRLQEAGAAFPYSLLNTLVCVDGFPRRIGRTPNLSRIATIATPQDAAQGCGLRADFAAFWPRDCVGSAYIGLAISEPRMASAVARRALGSERRAMRFVALFRDLGRETPA